MQRVDAQHIARVEHTAKEGDQANEALANVDSFPFKGNVQSSKSYLRSLGD